MNASICMNVYLFLLEHFKIFPLKKSHTNCTITYIRVFTTFNTLKNTWPQNLFELQDKFMIKLSLMKLSQFEKT